MRKILSFFLLLLATGFTSFLASCSDDDDVNASTDREFMTMFINDNTRGKGDDYPYNCGLDGAYPHGNTIHLYWYGVNDCAGYEIQMARQPKVSGGESAWEAIQGTSDLLLDTIIPAGKLDMLIKDLDYSTTFSFAIRALSPLDENNLSDRSSFAHASNWFGHGNGRQWQEYEQITTHDRYETPNCVFYHQGEPKETKMRIYINSNINQLGLDPSNPKDKSKLDSYHENFNIDANGNFGFKILTVKPSPSNPNATVNAKWSHYVITDADRNAEYTDADGNVKHGYIDIDGLSPNSVYVVDVIDPTVKVAVDAKYNNCTPRTDGKPGPPIYLHHDDLMNAKYDNIDAETPYKRSSVFALASNYNAAPLSPTLKNFVSDITLAEGQTFYLDGGKTYYIDGNDPTCKGFVLATNPADVARGLRAKVICGIGKESGMYSATNGEQWQGSYTMFLFGRAPEAGESGEIYMKKLEFENIDFDNPTALNHGDAQAGAGSAAGNYFFNMLPNGMSVTLDSLVIKDCKFKRIVRGFIREQGPNYKVWNHVLIDGNEFYDCGYYNQGAGGYCWINGSGNNVKSNLWKDMKVINNTFYDSPFPALFNEPKDGMEWTGGAWHITFSNNTLVNFNTRANGAIFKMRCMPDGSSFTVENNLLVLTKQSGDQRTLGFWGSDVRNPMTRSDGTAGNITLNFHNNWSTSNNLTNGQIFSGNAWSSTSTGGFMKLVRDGAATLNGTLDVEVGDVSATQLFISPNPPHRATSATERNMHRADAIDGTAKAYNVNLYFKSTSNKIAEHNVGAPRWRKGSAAAAARRYYVARHRR